MLNKISNRITELRRLEEKVENYIIAEARSLNGISSSNLYYGDIRKLSCFYANLQYHISHLELKYKYVTRGIL